MWGILRFTHKLQFLSLQKYILLANECHDIKTCVTQATGKNRGREQEDWRLGWDRAIFEEAEDAADHEQ